MKFKQRTNVANISDEIFNQRDSLIRSKIMDLDNPNNVKKKLVNTISPKYLSEMNYIFGQWIHQVSILNLTK